MALLSLPSSIYCEVDVSVPSHLVKLFDSDSSKSKNISISHSCAIMVKMDNVIEKLALPYGQHQTEKWAEW